MDIDTYDDLRYEAEAEASYADYIAEQEERRWRQEVDERYGDYLADCAEVGETPVPVAEWEEQYVDSLVAEAERRAEGGL